MRRDDLARAAKELRQLVTAMEIKGEYWDDDRNRRIAEYLAVLRPVQRELGIPIKLGPNHAAPPRVWFPHLKNFAQDAYAWLKANPEWVPPARRIPETFLHPRLAAYIRTELEAAARTDAASDWEKVAAQSLRFLETDLRKRIAAAGLDSPEGRKDVPAIALRKGTGPVRLGDDEYEEDAWRMYAQGLLVALGNESAHFISEVAAEMAVGVAGAVSILLLKLDAAYGAPP